MNKVLGIVLIVLLGTVANSDGLITCVCSGQGVICSSDGTCQGQLCFSKVLYPAEQGGEEEHRKGCYFNAQASSCNTSTALHTTVCCHGDRCNEDLNPTLAPTQPPGEPSRDPISPGEAGGNSDHTLMPPTGSGSPSCYESDSSLVGSTVGTCPLESFCYSTLRRRNDGTVVQRRGCATTCTEETRNRKIKRCCNTSLCNGLIEDPMPPSTTPTAPPTTPLPTQPSTPLATYRPPTLNPLPPSPSDPTDAPPTAPPTNGTLITCHCDSCPGNNICMTDVACGSWYHYGDVASGGTLTVMNFCLSSTTDCGPMTGTNDHINCCFEDYCNNVEVATTIESTTVADTTETTEKEHTSSSTVATTTQTTHGTQLPTVNQDIYYLVGIGIFVVAGVILVVIAIAVTCYCVLSRRPTHNQKARKATEASKARFELAVGTTLSFPSPQIYSSRRESSRESISTDANSSSLPMTENIVRTPYSSTSV